MAYRGARYIFLAVFCSDSGYNGAIQILTHRLEIPRNRVPMLTNTFRTKAYLSLLALPLLFAQAGLAQSNADDAAAAATVLACGGLMLAIPLSILVLNILLLVWVAKDAKARGMDNSTLWMVVVMFTSFIGLIIYLMSRPKGQLAPCDSCGNKRMAASAICPHCGNA